MIDTIKLSAPAAGEFWEIEVLFEDEHLLALNKPPCLLTSPDRYDPNRPNLMKLLHGGIIEGKPWARTRKLEYLANAHRLDFETSGVILLAKTKPVLVALSNLFSTDKPQKTYAALVHGRPAETTFDVHEPLGPHPIHVGQVRVDRDKGKKSKTLFEVRESFRNHTLLTCRPITGRTHQIRVHLKFFKLPIVGDQLYGGRELFLSDLKSAYHLKPGRTERPLISTTALHAEELSLKHPVTQDDIKVTAAWPKDLRVALKYLRLHAAI